MAAIPLILSALEVDALRALNEVVEPWLRDGLLSHELAPLGVVVVEARGRRTGRTFNVPLLALRMDDHLIVSTVRRRRSQWIRNLTARPEGKVWLAGRPRRFHALVFRDDLGESPELPGDVRAVVSFLRALRVPRLAVAVLCTDRGRSAPVRRTDGWGQCRRAHRGG